MNVEKIKTLSQSIPISPYVQTGSMIFVSGQGGIDPKSSEVVGTDLYSQTKQTITNLSEILISAGADLKDVVKVTVYLSDRKLYQEFNEIYKQFFQPPYPSRTAIYCDLNYDLLVEIDVIAVKKSG